MSGNKLENIPHPPEENVIRPIPAILLIAVVSGCASTGPSTGPSAAPNQRPAGPPPATARPVYNLAGYSPAFKDGYIDGCETAKKTPTASRTRAACLPIRNIASGGMTASACVVESSNSARPENVKRVRRYQRCLPLNTRQWRRFAASCVYGHGHGMCGDARPETKRRRAA